MHSTNLISFRQKTRPLLYLALAAFVSFCSKVSSETVVSGELSLGYEYDSNVTVDEVDRDTNVGDGGLLAVQQLALCYQRRQSAQKRWPLEASNGFGD